MTEKKFSLDAGVPAGFTNDKMFTKELSELLQKHADKVDLSDMSVILLDVAHDYGLLRIEDNGDWIWQT